MKKQLTDDVIRSIFSKRRRKRAKRLTGKELRRNVTQLRAAINRNASFSNQKIPVYPYWLIDCHPDQRLQEYTHLIVLPNATPDGETRIKLLKIELDSGNRIPRSLMKKMVGLTGYGLVLCPAVNRFDKFIKAYKSVAQTEKIVTDGIYFGLTSDVLEQGILGPTFTSLNGTSVIFSAYI
jgi:hypothetical protein